MDRQPFTAATHDQNSDITALKSVAPIHPGRIWAEEPINVLASPQPKFLIIIWDRNNPLVSVRPDCTVVVHEGANLDEASRLFWDSIQTNGKSYVRRAEDAEARVRELEAVIGRKQ